MKKDTQEFWQIMKGSEIWTDAFGSRFGERVCVGIDYPYVINAGEKFKPTDKEWAELKDDYYRQEYGTTDMNRIMAMEGF